MRMESSLRIGGGGLTYNRPGRNKPGVQRSILFALADGFVSQRGFG